MKPENKQILDRIDVLTTQELESTGSGVISGLTVTTQSTPDMTVNVASGIVHMPNGTRLTPTGNSALTITTADATNPRIDIVYVNPNNIIEYMAGTPAAIPIAPNTPTGAFLLYQINVPAGVTEITNSNIVDMREIKNTTDNNADAIANLTEDFDEHKADYMYQIATIVGTQIQITKQSDTKRLYFQLTSDLSGEAITISTDGGTTSKPLQDIDENVVTMLEKGFVEVVADANFFTLRNRGISPSQKQALIDITNAAEANQSTIKTNIANALNSKIGTSLTSASSWTDMLNAILTANAKRWANGNTTLSSSGEFSVTGLTFQPKTIVLKERNTDPSSSMYVACWVDKSILNDSYNATVRVSSNSSAYVIDSVTTSSSSFTLTISNSDWYSKQISWVAYE